MISRKLSVVALSGCTLALALGAMAQDTTATTSSSTTTTTTTGDMAGGTTGMAKPDMAKPMMSMEPMQVTGTVERYYTDRAGYVTAMDVQTPDGTRMVRFGPGMAQRLYSTYPVGGQITGMVQPSMAMGMSRYDLVAMGDQMPAGGMMKPYMASDIETLKSEPYIMAGQGLIQFHGKLQSVVTDDMGEVLALVLKGAKLPGMMGGMMKGSMADSKMAGGDMAGGAMAGGAMAGGAMTGTDSTTNTMSTGGMMAGGGMMGGGMMGGMMDNLVLVRVPRELRHNSGGQMAASERVAPLFKGSNVEVVGYAEAPRYGVMSPYAERVAATALVVNDRAVGAVGLPMVQMNRKGSLFGNAMGMKMNKGSKMSKEEMGAMNMGYSTYGMSTDMSSGMSTSTDPSMTTGTTGATGGTTGGTTGTTGTTGGM